MYPWFVALHVVGVALFLITHGVSMWVAFRLRRETNRDVIAALLGMSARSNQVMYLGLALLGIGGLAAAGSVGWLTTTWVLASYVVFLAVLLTMFVVASPFYYRLRDGLEGTDKVPRLDDEALLATLHTRRPEALVLVGGSGLLILIWLMAVKPG
jgi:small-conductance mechanosensitive channel